MRITAVVGRAALRSAMRSGKLISGTVILAIFVIVAIVGPYIVSRNPSALSSATLRGPSATHWLGTTQTGQDVWAQLIDSTRISMLVGFVAAAVATALSVIIGVAGGYAGGVVDELLSVLSNVFLVIPALPLVIVLAGYLPNRGSISVALVISITGWAWGARDDPGADPLAEQARLRRSSPASGEGSFRILFWEILPHEGAIIAATFLGIVVFAILTQAGIAFLGLSDVTAWSWGTMLYWAEADQALLLGAWWWFVPPGLAIGLVGTALALMNFGIDELINPRLRTAGIGTKAAARKLMRDTRRERAIQREEAAAPRRRVLGSGTADDGHSSDMRADPSGAGEVLLDVQGISIDYGAGRGAANAVDNVSLQLHRGEVLGIAGESGSGKTTLAFAISRLLRPPGQVTGGRVIYHPRTGESVDLLKMSDAELRAFRWSALSLVFQSAMNTLNPVLRLKTQFADVLRAHRRGIRAEEIHNRTIELLQMVGITADRAEAYAHELSGGMRQRATIALALALEPEIIVMDEPTTALDVVLQRQILSEIMKLQSRLGFSVIFITHDLSLLIELADTIMVMYAGRLVEVGATAELHQSPRHPYSRGLLAPSLYWRARGSGWSAFPAHRRT